MKTSNVASGMVVQHSAWSIPYVIGVAATLPLMSDHARGRGWLMRERPARTDSASKLKGVQGAGWPISAYLGTRDLHMGSNQIPGLTDGPQQANRSREGGVCGMGMEEDRNREAPS